MLQNYKEINYYPKSELRSRFSYFKITKYDKTQVGLY